MTDIKVAIIKESIPERHVQDCEISITIACKPSAQWKLDLLLGLITDIEGWDFQEDWMK